MSIETYVADNITDSTDESSLRDTSQWHNPMSIGHTIYRGAETMNILLIEDDQDTAEYASNGLTQAGHVVNVVHDGKEGMVHCMHTDYDVLIVDRMLPGWTVFRF